MLLHYARLLITSALRSEVRLCLPLSVCGIRQNSTRVTKTLRQAGGNEPLMSCEPVVGRDRCGSMEAVVMYEFPSAEPTPHFFTVHYNLLLPPCAPTGAKCVLVDEYCPFPLIRSRPRAGAKPSALGKLFIKVGLRGHYIGVRERAPADSTHGREQKSRPSARARCAAVGGGCSVQHHHQNKNRRILCLLPIQLLLSAEKSRLINSKIPAACFTAFFSSATNFRARSPMALRSLSSTAQILSIVSASASAELFGT